MKQSQENKNLFEVEKLIRLPNLKKLSVQESPFPKTEGQLFNDSILSNSLRKNLIDQRQILRNEFYKYQNEPNFSFYFPLSKFPPVPKGSQNLISYEKKPFIQPQNTFRERLSSDQISQIKQKGQFSVKSQREWAKIPYIWQLNDTIFKGINRVRNDFNERLSLIHSFANQTWIMITEDFSKQILKVIKFPYRMFCLLVGKQSLKVNLSVDYNREIAKDFWNEVMSEYYIDSREWFSQLWAFLDTKISTVSYLSLQLNDQSIIKNQVQASKRREEYEKKRNIQNDKIQKINKISNEFNENWNKINKKVFLEISQKIEKKYTNQMGQQRSKQQTQNLKNQKQKQILSQFSQQQFNRYTGYLSQELPKINVPLQAIEALLTLLTLINITTRKQRQFEIKKSIQKDKIQKQLQRKHPILSSNYNWYYNRIQQEFQQIEPQLKAQFYASLTDQNIRKRLSHKQIQVIKLWTDYLRNYEIRLQQKKQLKQDLYEPQRIFQSTYALLPPYQIIRYEADPANYNTQVRYQMVKSRKTQISTGGYFWKIFLYCMRLKTWTINCFVILVYGCLKGPFGLRCLCGIDKFSYDQDINAVTGEIIHSMRKTVLGRFQDVLDGIRKSRAQFQALPDTGLFGKTCSRLYNLIECYIFRFFIVGIIIILTFYPIAITFVSLFLFLLIITIWMWMPLVLLVTYLFNILIFQFETCQDYVECYHRIFPVFMLVFKLLFSICKIVFYVVSFFIITPLVSIAVFLFACLCFCMRSVSDSLVLCFIRCCGHTPNTNSVFATKISGPDMAIQQFMSLSQEDVYILIQSELQQLHLQLISKITRQKISQPYENFKKILRIIIEPLLGNNRNSSYQNSSINFNEANNPIQKNSQLLLTKFNEDQGDFKKRYPKRPNYVRFTAQQLNEYLHNTQQIVTDYVNKNRLNKWIFNRFSIAQEDYEELTRKIWINLFQCDQQIFQPLQSIDQRFRLQEQQSDQIYGFNYNKMRLNVSQVANAIKGEINLQQKKVAKFAPANPHLFNQRVSLTQTKNIFEFTLRNSSQSVNFSIQHPTFIFFPHLSIKQLIRYDQAQYAYKRGKNTENWKKW